MGILIRLLFGLGVIGGIAKLFSSDDEKEFAISDDSNCQNEFLKFNDALNITPTKKKKLKRAVKAIQSALKNYFKEQQAFTIPRFALQGSYKCGTMVRTTKDTCDFDLGVYFFSQPTVSYETIQKHIKIALDGRTEAGIKLLSKCVRLNYSDDYHIDMPVYFTSDGKNFLLGSKGDDWEVCDSKLFKDWVNKEADGNQQIIRIVRYLKSWADFHRNRKKQKMPSGLVFTIWAIEFYEKNDRDDIALVSTVAKILSYLKDNSQRNWSCEMPVAPFDNVLDKLNSSQQSNFYEALEDFVKNGFISLQQNDKKKSIAIWRKLLGPRFL